LPNPEQLHQMERERILQLKVEAAEKAKGYSLANKG
jgi:hypothetical protein